MSPRAQPEMIEAELMKSEPGIRHGFFTRQGGVSEGIYASLNCGLGSGDDRSRVRRNRALVADRLGTAPAKLVTPRQGHTDRAIIAHAPWRDDCPPEADAVVTNVPGLAIGVLTADCAPVLLADPRAKVVAAVHAGWRGAKAGVLQSASCRWRRWARAAKTCAQP